MLFALCVMALLLSSRGFGLCMMHMSLFLLEAVKMVKNQGE